MTLSKYSRTVMVYRLVTGLYVANYICLAPELLLTSSRAFESKSFNESACKYSDGCAYKRLKETLASVRLKN